MKGILCLLMLVTSTHAMADLRASMSTSSHGVGLPRTVGTHPYAVAHREQFKNNHQITSYISESTGIKHYRNGKVGLALIKNTNTDEAIFQGIIRGTQVISTWSSGNTFLKALEDYTSQYGCVPKVTSVSHGWRSENDGGDFHGLSGSRGFNGIYSRRQYQPTGPIHRIGTRSLDQEMRALVRQGKIRFCQTCIAQFYACNISTDFANVLQRLVDVKQSSPQLKHLLNIKRWDQKLSAKELIHLSTIGGVGRQSGVSAVRQVGIE